MEKNYNLFLDDQRNPEKSMDYTGNINYYAEHWLVAKNYPEFVIMVKNNMPKKISFDHDLHPEHYEYSSAINIPYSEFKNKTGYHCLLWLIMYCNKKIISLPKILIHTMNVTGKKNMTNLISSLQTIKNDI